MSAVSIAAQTTAFTFQGRLNTSGSPASGTYEMQFQLFDSVKGGAQIGATFTDPNVAVVNGVFTTTLDFGAAAFDGSARFVEIGVRTAGNPDPFTTLAPRQTIKSAPYSIQSKNAATADALSANCVNCVTSGQIQSIDGSQVTGAIPPASVPMGSDNYIQNAAVFRGEGKDGGQPAARFNIGGNATVGSLDVNGPASFAAVGAPAVAPAGQGRIYFDSGSNKVKVSENGGAFVNLVGATGVSGSGTANSIPVWSAGTTLGSSLITQAGGAIQLPNNVQLAPGTNGNVVQFGSPNSETGMTMAGPNGRADVRFDGTTLRLLSGPAGGPPSNGVAVTSSNVQLPNNVLLGVGAQGNQVQFGSPNGETGMTIAGAGGRADVRFDGSTLRLFNGPAGSPPANGVAINSSGNVGIGTSSPDTRFTLSGGPQWTSNLWTASMNLRNGSAIGWDANASGRRWGIGQSTGALYFFRSFSPFGTTASPADYAMSITDDGNITQPLANNGLVKAMVYVDSANNILRCYNSTVGGTAASTPPCTFVIGTNSNGLINVNFRFTVNDRFISVTGRGSTTAGNPITASFNFSSDPQVIHVTTSPNPAPFMIFVY